MRSGSLGTSISPCSVPTTRVSASAVSDPEGAACEQPATRSSAAAETIEASERRLDMGTPGTAQKLRRMRSEEHTSELQSRFDLVCRLLLEKKKQIVNRQCGNVG